MPEKTKLRKGLEQLINSVSAEGGSNTPDFILADFLNESLVAFDKAVNAREKWFGRPGAPVMFPLGCSAFPGDPPDGGLGQVPDSALHENHTNIEESDQ